VKHLDSTQYAMSGVGVLPGADLDWGQIDLPCSECGEMVDLSGVISVNIVGQDGTEGEPTEMTEANARALLATVGIVPPPVLCELHDPEEVVRLPWQ